MDEASSVQRGQFPFLPPLDRHRPSCTPLFRSSGGLTERSLSSRLRDGTDGARACASSWSAHGSRAVPTNFSGFFSRLTATTPLPLPRQTAPVSRSSASGAAILLGSVRRSSGVRWHLFSWTTSSALLGSTIGLNLAVP